MIINVKRGAGDEEQGIQLLRLCLQAITARNELFLARRKHAALKFGRVRLAVRALIDRA